MCIQSQKAEKRKVAFAARKAAFAQGLDAAANHNLLASLATFDAAQVIAGYMPIQTEISPLASMIALFGRQKTICIPVIQGPAQPLLWAKWGPEIAMVEGAFKAKIPENPEFVTPDLAIVPIVAFDRKGGRLGYGGGFYDRSLEILRAGRHAPAVGFAYAAQELPHLPLESTDQKLDLLVTEQEVLRF
ncbi:MAG: 5-formyltetrahydrofolate cyclo-ligase [Pseudomonadota bacterium]